MSWQDKEDTTIYKVVINHEEQYSIWPAERENALGWNDAGKQGTKAECLAYIKEVWTDMRPLSLRKKMEKVEKERQAADDALSPETRARRLRESQEALEEMAKERERIRKEG